MFANFLNLAFSSCPSDNTTFTGFVERTGLELEPFFVVIRITPLEAREP